MTHIKHLPEVLFASFLSISIFIGFNPIIINFLADLFTHRFSLPFAFNFYNLKRIDELSILLITGLLLIFSRKLRMDLFQAWSFLSKSVQIAISLFFGLGLISAIFAIHAEPAFLEFTNQTLLFILGLLISRQVLHARFLFSLKMAFIVGIGFYVFFAICSYLLTYYQFVRGTEFSLNALQYLTVYPQFLNPRFLAQVFILTWPILIYASTLTWKRRPALSLFILFMSSYWMALGLENQSRAIFLSLGIAFITLLFLLKEKRDHLSLWFKFLAANILSSLLITYVLFTIGLNFENPFLALIQRSSEEVHYMDRINLWSFTLQNFILPHPFLGVGPLNFASIPNPVGVAHPHNVILKIAAEWGAPAALIFCFILIKAVIAWIKFFRKSIQSPHLYLPKLLIQSSFMLILVGGFIDSLLSGNTVMPLSQLFLATLGGWAYGLVTENHLEKYPQKQEHQRQKKKHHLHHLHQDLWLTLGLLIAIVVLITISTHNLIHLSTQTEKAVETSCKNNQHCTLPPLFWFPEQVSPLQTWF
jgi:putative inorganic carbon (hco3(-)) transporter